MTSPLADPSLSANSASVYTDLKGLASLKREAQAQTPESVRTVARQFESIFAKMVLSSMRQASFGDPIMGSQQTEFYQGMFDDQLAVELTKGKGLGLADMLVRQLTQSGMVPKGADAATSGDGSDAALKGAAGGAGRNGAFPLGASDGSKNAFLPLTGKNGIPRAIDGAEHNAGLPLGTYSGAKSAALAAAANRGAKNALSGAGVTDSLAAAAAENSDSPFSSTLVGDTTQSAFLASADFISKMRSANADAGTQWQAGSPEEFVQKLWPCAEEAGRELGIDPRHLLAQAALETGWGKSLPCATDGSTSFNFFGIKAGESWQGDSVSVRTLEFEGGVPVPRQAKFRSYDSPADGFRDYVEVLRNNPRYADALNTGSDAKAFASALQKGGYATDPAYANKITAIAQNLPINETALKSSTDTPMSPPIAIF